MSKNIFITATGTDIGKTYISALIVKKMREAGYNCGYFKPVLSGVVAQNGILKDSDCNYVVNIAKLPVPPDDCTVYWWEEAVSPHLASERAGNAINIENIKGTYDLKNKLYDYMLIEGAGGITCPLVLKNNQKYLMKDLIKEFQCDVIIIADGGLGTINSVLLTVEYAKANNINIVGIILNNFEADNFMHQDNLKQIEYLTGIRVLTTVAHNQKDIILLNEYFK